MEHYRICGIKQCSTCTSELFSAKLKMTGKGFVLFKMNSSPTAFYIIKPTCISWLVFKMSKYFFKKLSKSTNPNVCLCWLVMMSSPSESKHPACLYSSTALNLILGRCQHSLSLIIMSSDEIGSLGLFTAGLQPLQASVAWTQPVRPVTHTFSYCAQFSIH